MLTLRAAGMAIEVDLSSRVTYRRDGAAAGALQPACRHGGMVARASPKRRSLAETGTYVLSSFTIAWFYFGSMVQSSDWGRVHDRLSLFIFHPPPRLRCRYLLQLLTEMACRMHLHESFFPNFSTFFSRKFFNLPYFPVYFSQIFQLFPNFGNYGQKALR